MKCLVIGAGMFGASTAFELAQQGHHVTIVDAMHQGRATSAGAGIVCPWATSVTDEAWYQVYASAADYYPQVVKHLESLGESTFGYRRVGALVVSDDNDKFIAAGERIHQRTRHAPNAGDVRQLTPTQAKERFPVLAGTLPAHYIEGGARVDARLLSTALVRAAVSKGASYLNDFITLKSSGQRVTAFDGAGHPIPADEIILCGGSWARHILAPLGISHEVSPQKGQIVHLHLKGVATANWPVLLPMNSYYLLSFDDSRVVIGATREENSGFDYRVTASGQNEVLAAGLSIAPGLADAELIETRIGFRPVGPSLRPFLGRVPGIDNLSVGNALGASGISLGPLAGRLLAQTVTGQVTDLPPNLMAAMAVEPSSM